MLKSLQATPYERHFMPRCAHPWQTLMIDAAGVVQPCAYRGNYTNIRNAEPFGNVNTQSLAEIWNGPVAQRVRSCMASGDLEGAGCGDCLALKQGHKLGIEAAQFIVKDTKYADNIALKNIEFDTGAASISSLPTILYYTPSHHCNLRCVHCYQGTSRSLSVRDSADTQVLELLPYLSDIVAGGGEPLILPVWRRLVENFDEKLNPHLRFCTTTNAMFLRDDVIEGLRRIPRIAIIVSIDGIGDTFEAIRDRADWPTFSRNMRSLHAMCVDKGAPFGLNVSVMKQNVVELAQLVDLAAELETLVNFQPVVAYPIDCSLRCFNTPPANWEQHFDSAQKSLDRLVSVLKRAGSRFKGWDNLWSFESQAIQAKAARDLVPWHLFERRHTRTLQTVPEANRPAVSFVREYSVSQNWPRATACIVFAEKGNPEPHWYGPIDENFCCEVSLPSGQFDAWVVQIDSVPLNADYARQHGTAWDVEV